MKLLALLVLLLACVTGCEKECVRAEYLLIDDANERVLGFDAPYFVCDGQELRRDDANDGFAFERLHPNSECSSDEDCDLGICVFQIFSESMIDSSGSGSFNLGGAANQSVCIPAECSSGADCESGICRAGFNGCGRVVSFGCATENDTCEEVDDCGWPNQGGCQPGEGGFQCRGQDCPIDE